MTLTTQQTVEIRLAAREANDRCRCQVCNLIKTAYGECDCIPPAPAEAATEIGADDDGGEWSELDAEDKLWVSYVIVLLVTITMGGLYLALLMTKP